MKTLKDLRTAVENKEAKVLTIALANQLKGKRIATIYFGYKGQDGINEFTVGEIVSELEIARRDVAFSEIDPRFNNRAEYWESYMTESQLNEEKSTLHLLTDEGKETYIRAHSFNKGEFTCSDSDRNVFFIEL